MTHGTNANGNRSTVTRSARKAAGQVVGGSDTVTDLKRATSRKARRTAKAALQSADLDTLDGLDLRVRPATSHDVW